MIERISCYKLQEKIIIFEFWCFYLWLRGRGTTLEPLHMVPIYFDRDNWRGSVYLLSITQSTVLEIIRIYFAFTVSIFAHS